jgi:SAM-dependent methyltransferase
MLEYEMLDDLKLEGKVLDLGGGDKSKYREKLPSDIDYQSVNIDPSIEPTWLVEPGEPIPAEDSHFDYCISLNTLEHVYDPVFLVREIYRLLKAEGTVHIMVPWIFQIHGHPDDFTRATPSWWRRTLEDAGFDSAEVTPLVWGRYSSGASITGIRGLFKGTRRHLVHARDSVNASLFFGRAGAYTGRRGQHICNIASGHLITATK